MKNKLIILMLLVSSALLAQNPLEKNVGDFNEVKVYDLIEVNLIKAEENKVVISGQDVQDVQVINKNGKLKIRMNLDKIFNGDETFVEVHYRSIEIIDGNEGAFISSNELIEQEEILLIYIFPLNKARHTLITVHILFSASSHTTLLLSL